MNVKERIVLSGLTTATAQQSSTSTLMIVLHADNEIGRHDCYTDRTLQV